MSTLTMLEPAIAWVLFTIEWYHIWGHMCIVFRIRMLPRKDLVRLRLYFLVDLLTVFTSSLFTGKLYWLASLQILQHAYYYVFWDKTDLAKRIINWSCLDYLRSDLRNRWELDSLLGTLFDVAVHLCFAYYLGSYLSTVMAIASLVLVQASVILLLFGPHFAWSCPKNIPKWVEKRIHPEVINKQHAS